MRTGGTASSSTWTRPPSSSTACGAASPKPDRDLSGFEVTVTPRGRIDAEAVAAYGRLGVNRLVLMPRGGHSLDEVEAFVRAHAPERLAAASLAV